MQVFFQPTNTSFLGKTESFWRMYHAEMKNTPLRETILKSIKNEENLLGEGLSKKVYNIKGIKNYIIRIYKKYFKLEDLQRKFSKPEKNFLNFLEGVVLSIPGKIDIVKRKIGKSIGIPNYAKHLNINNNPLENMHVEREETLRLLSILEQVKRFPLKSYLRAYAQVQTFCKKTGFQFDIISPNNILIDGKAQKINLIDPVTPEVNKPVHGENTDLSAYHGTDSLYPILCDFIMHKEHLANLTPEEKTRWEKSVNIIISKCLRAGKIMGFGRNIDKMKILYTRIEKFWKTDKLSARFDDFLNKYSGTINEPQLVQDALNYKNTANIRINAIRQLSNPKFSYIRPVLEKIIEAPHQPKVEFPEILNAALDKILEYGKDAKSITPTLETLFEKEIFYTTKKRLYNLFLTLQPRNKTFLNEISKSSENPLERTLYREEFEALQGTTKGHSKRINQIYNNSLSGERVSEEIADKLWISRTCTKTSNTQKITLKNMENAYHYIESKQKQIPTIDSLIELHKIIFADIPDKTQIVGRLRTPETNELVKKIFNIKKDTRNTICDYSAPKDVVNDLKKLNHFISENYDSMDTFALSAYIFNEIIRIHPFLDGNGRATRLFTEQFLLSKGYRLTKWPEEILYRQLYSAQEFTEILRQCCVIK